MQNNSGRPPDSMSDKENVLLTQSALTRVAQLEAQVSALTTSFNQFSSTPFVSPTPQAVNQLRNGSLTYSVNGWAAVGTANNGRYECAWWFSHPTGYSGQAMSKANTKDGDLTITFGSTDVNVGANTITLTGSDLVTGMAFFLTVVGGATLPAPLVVNTIYYAIVIDANTIKVASTAANALAGTAIVLTNAGAGNFHFNYNYELNWTSSTQYSPAFSDWDWITGTARFQGTTDISTFLGGANADPGLSYYLGFNVVRASRYVTASATTRIGVGLYGDSTARGWEWLSGTFTATAVVQGTVATPTTRDYVVQVVTDRGFTIQSTPLTVANAPSDADFAGGARVTLSWPQALNYGVVSYDIYRNTAGTYRLLKSVATGQLNYIDNNVSTAVAGYPSYTFNRLVAYSATRNGIIGTLPYVSDPKNPSWATIPFALRMPQNFDKSDLIITDGQWLRLYLSGLAANGCLDFTTSDGAMNNGSGTLTSAAAQFTDGSAGSTNMVGLAVTVTDSSGNVLTTTVAGYTNSTTITLTANWTFANATGCIVYISGGAPPHSLWINQIHLDYVEGAAFAPNAADVDGTHGAPSVLLNGTTQGGGGRGGGGGDGAPLPPPGSGFRPPPKTS